MAQISAAVSRTLFYALQEHVLLTPASRVVFLRARYSPELPGLRDQCTELVLEQAFAPDFLTLQEHGFQAAPEVACEPSTADVVLYLATRFQEENLQQMVCAMQWLRPGGKLIVCQHNDLGGRRLLQQLVQLAGEAQVTSVSKNHCRAVVAMKTSAVDGALLSQWQSVIREEEVSGTPLKSHAGLFSWQHVDAGSAFLAEHLPATMKGHGVDIGAGWGYLAWELAKRIETGAKLTLIEADHHALQMARKNMEQVCPETACTYLWWDAARSWPQTANGFDWAVMNPPMHDLYQESPQMVEAIFRSTADALKPRAPLWLVANRHLPYEAKLAPLFASVSVRAENRQYKILEAVR